MRALPLFLLFFSAPVWAQEAPASAQLLVPAVQGNADWGAQQLTRSLRAVLEPEVGPLVPDGPFDAALAQQPAQLRNTQAGVVEAAKTAGAQYVLWVVITKRGWLYTARALLLKTETGEIQMDFRSDYYKPTAEAEDRALRIARKVSAKLGTLLTPAVVPPPPPPVVATGTVSTEPVIEPPPPDSSTDFASEFGSDFGSEFDGFSDEGGWEWSISGWVGASVYAFAHPDVPSEKDRIFGKLGVRSTLTGKLGSLGRIRVLPLIEVDGFGNRLHRMVLEEGFVELGFGAFELRVGWDALSWGAASTLNIVDVINARNLREGFIDAPKIGQPMIAGRFLFGNHSLSLLLLSPYVPSQFPRGDSPFSPFNNTPAPLVPGGPLVAPPELGDNVVYASEFNQWYPQVAGRLALALGKVDLRATYFHGYSRFPLVLLSTQTLFFPLIHTVSTDGQVLLGSTAIKWEVASIWHQQTDRGRAPPVTQPNGLPSDGVNLPGHRISTILGVEHTFEGIWGGMLLVPVMELVLDSDSTLFTDNRPPDDLLRFFQNHLITGAQLSFENAMGSKIRVVDLMDLSRPRDHAIEARYSQRLFTHFTGTVGARWIFGETGGKLAAFEQLSSVFTELKLNY